MGLTIQFNEEGLPCFAQDDLPLTHQEGMITLRKRLMSEHQIGAEAATHLLMEVTGKSRAKVHNWLTGVNRPMAEDLLRLRKRFDL